MYQPNYERIARKIVQESLQIQPGEQVLLEVRSDAVPYGEQIAIEIFKAGGVATVLLSSDELNYRQIMESPLEQLAVPIETLVAAYQNTDYNVTVGMYEAEPLRFQNLPLERERAFGERRRARTQAIYGANSPKWLGTDYPTRQMADVFGVPWTEFFEMYWRAMDVDYTELRERATAVAEQLEQSDEIHIRSPQGTDVRFRRGGREIFCDDGTLRRFGNLPAGEVYFAPIEASVEGEVVFDRAFSKGQRISNLKLRFEGGIGTPISADEGFEVFMHQWDLATEDKNRIGEMGIGINDEIHAPTGYLLTDEKIMGTVHLAIGHNQLMGGANKSTLHWDMVILQPTVTLDDVLLLDEGRFALKF